MNVFSFNFYVRYFKKGIQSWCIYIYIYIYIYILCYLPKSKRGMALAFSANFLYMFYIKMFLTKYHISWPSFCIIPNFLTKITNSVFSNSVLANWWRDKLYNLALSSSPVLTDKSKKRGGNNAENYVN